MVESLTSENRGKKIAYCIPSFRFGGGERVMVDLANWTAQQGLPVDLVVLAPTGQYQEQVDRRVRITSFRSPRFTFAFPSLVLYLLRERPAVLMALDETTHIFSLMAKMCTFSRTRIVIRVGTMLSMLYATRPGLKDQMRYKMLQFFYRRADAVIANSSAIVDDLVRNLGVARGNISLIYNPKRLDELAQAAAQPMEHPWLAPGHEVPVIAAVGRFREQKGFDDIIRAFAQARARVLAHLMMIGDGRDKPRLEALAEELGVASDVSFVGFTDNPHAYVARADIFAMASWWEGMPNSLVEALICGTPAVATDCNGPREVMATQTDPLIKIEHGIEWTSMGALVPVKGVRELAEAFVELLPDRERRAQMGQAARARGRDFDAPAILGRYLEVLGVS